MASTDETTGTSKRAAARAANGETADKLEEQVARLQEDVKTILQTLARMGNDKVAEGQARAKREYSNIVHAGEGVIETVQGEFTELEKQVKDTIRQKPLMAVLGAMGIGFLIAVLTR